VQLDARNLGILLGAAMVIGALSAPWFVLDMAAAREALGVNTPQMPEMLGQFVREIAAALPDKISADGWQAFERGDVVLLAAALAAGFAALMDRHEVSTFCGAGAAGLVVVSSRIAGAEEPDAVSTEADWFARSEQTEHARASGTAAEVWASPAAGSGSVPPPG